MGWDEEAHPRDERGRFTAMGRALVAWREHRAGGAPSGLHAGTLAAWAKSKRFVDWDALDREERVEPRDSGGSSKKMYWRVQWDDLPKFSAQNAKSKPWGSDEKPVEGYSATESASSLREYFDARGGIPDNARVVAFEGRIAGYGPDGEPLVVPTKTHGWIRGHQLSEATEHEERGAQHDFLKTKGSKSEPKVDKKALKLRQQKEELAKKEASLAKYLADRELLEQHFGQYADQHIAGLQSEIGALKSESIEVKE